MGKGISGGLSKDSTQVVKLGMTVLIGIAILQVIQNTGLVSNTTGNAFQTALAVYGSFVIVYIIWSIAKPIMAGFGKN